jgi:Ankyrin repeat
VLGPSLYSCLSSSDGQKARVDYQDPDTGQTPIMLAIENGRFDLIRELISHGADVSVTNAEQESPSVLAVKSESVATLTELQQANPALDDGSLHESVRRLDTGMVTLLLKNNHNPNHPSHIHGGRSALGELCLRVRATRVNQCKIEGIIKLLVLNKDNRHNKANIEIQESGKPLICVALDNQDPQPIVQALLKSYLWEHINKPFNMYEHDGFCYSPTRYVSKGLFLGPRKEKNALCSLLKQNQAKDIFYALEGPQPDDAIGMPADILKADKSRREREKRLQEEDEEHRRDIQRKREEEAIAQTMLQQRHALQLKQEKEKSRLEEEKALKSQRMRKLERTEELEHQRQLANQQTKADQARYRAELEHTNQIAYQQQKMIESKDAAESRRRRENDSYQQRRHERIMEQLQMQSAVAMGPPIYGGHNEIGGPGSQRLIEYE